MSDPRTVFQLEITEKACDLDRWHFYSRGNAWSLPTSWRRGELLDVKRYSDGSFKLIRLGDESEQPETVSFDNSVDCQNFISWWYKSVSAQMDER